MQDFKSDYLHFGISQTRKKLWLLQLMVSSRKWIKSRVTKLNVQNKLEIPISTTNNKETQMATKEIKTQTLSEMKDKYIGKTGTKEREEYEYELRMDVLGKMIKSARQERHLTQEELGRLIGVQKSQISKLESSANSATIDTIIKVFKALKAEINFNVKLEGAFVELT